MGFVIYLSSESNLDSASNSYGYWEGKTYQVQGETYPVAHDYEITHRTKVYKSKIRAENTAKKLYERCGYVLAWEVRPSEQETT